MVRSKVKLFRTRTIIHHGVNGYNIDYLKESEKEINDWIEDNNIIIISITGVQVDNQEAITYIAYIEVAQRNLLIEVKKAQQSPHRP